RTVAVKSSNDVTRLQALVDKKRVVVTEAAIRDALYLDDAERVDCLPNEEIFTELARMGYEKPSTKLTFYKAFFSSQWKFLIHTILQSMSAKRTSWNEFSSTMASAVICQSIGHKFNFSKYIFESLVRNVDSSTKFYMYPRFINLIIQNQLGDLSTHSTKYISPTLTQKVFANIRRVGKGCSGVETPLFKGMLVAREPEVQSDAEEQGAEEEQGNADTAAEEPKTAVLKDDAAAQTQGAHFLMSLLQEALDACAALARRVEHLEQDKVAHDLEIIKLKTRVKKLEKTNKAKTLKLRRLRKVRTSQRVDTSDDTLMEDVSNQRRVIDRDEDAVKEADEVMEYTADTQVEARQAYIYNIDMDHAAKVLSMQEDESEVQEAVEVVTTAKLITEVIASVSETVSVATVIPFLVPETISVAAAVPIDLEVESSAKTPTETSSKDKGKGILVEEPKHIKKKQQVELDEVYARKLQEEFNQDIDWEAAMDHVKQKSKEEPFIQRYQVMKKRPQTEAQARRNMMMYLKNTNGFREIEYINQTPTQKAAKRRKFIGEAKEAKTLKTMFEKPDGQDNVWRKQSTVHGQALVKSWKLLKSCGFHIISYNTTQIILLVERRYPLTNAAEKNDAAKSSKDVMIRVIKPRRSLLTLLLWLFYHQVLLLIMRSQPSGEYHVVPPPITGNFMPPKPDLVFHTAPIAVETAHSAFNVQLSPTKSAQDISQATRPIAPIIKD
nr:hypothetical protein [Tanacetum cinerariifolium]